MQYKDVNVKMFQAKAGDCIFVEFEKADFRILIDGGYVDTYQKQLKPFLEKLHLAKKHINLLIITHIDADHINGIKELLKDNGLADMPQVITIDEIWFNGLVHTNIKRNTGEIPVNEKMILQSMANNNRIVELIDGSHEIGLKQAASVSKLLADNKYHWNSATYGKAICTDNIKEYHYGNICIKVLGPSQELLNRLAEKWIEHLRNKVKTLVITDNHLFDDAFEGDSLNQKSDIIYERREISKTNKGDINWMLEAELDDDDEDHTIENLSSIAILICYNGMSILFPGDTTIQSICDQLPAKIDLVKLPHHGSGKNIDKNFIRNTNVEYYLLSTDGSKYGHPSKKVIGNIMHKAPGKPKILKNYDIPLLRGFGELEKE